VKLVINAISIENVTQNIPTWYLVPVYVGVNNVTYTHVIEPGAEDVMHPSFDNLQVGTLYAIPAGTYGQQALCMMGFLFFQQQNVPLPAFLFLSLLQFDMQDFPSSLHTLIVGRCCLVANNDPATSSWHLVGIHNKVRR